MAGGLLLPGGARLLLPGGDGALLLPDGVSVGLLPRVLRIYHAHRIEVRDMSTCTNRHTLVVPLVQQFADDTTPLGIIVRTADGYLDGSALTWAATATNPGSGGAATAWDSATATGAAGDADTPAVTLTMVGAALGLYLVALVGTSGAVRKEVRFLLEVV